MTKDREERIRRRAHEIWEREGQPHGRHDDHWQQAMDEIDHEADASAPGRGGSRNAAGGVSAAVTPRKGGKSAPAVEASPVQSQPTAKPRTATGGSKAAAAGSAEGVDASASSPAALRPSRGRKATVEGGEASGATPAPAKRTRKPAAPEQ